MSSSWLTLHDCDIGRLKILDKQNQNRDTALGR